MLRDVRGSVRGGGTAREFDAKGKLMRFGFTAFRDGSGGGSQTTSSVAPEVAGTYTYAVYDIAGIHYSRGHADGPAKDRIASGLVKVP